MIRGDKRSLQTTSRSNGRASDGEDDDVSPRVRKKGSEGGGEEDKTKNNTDEDGTGKERRRANWRGAYLYYYNKTASQNRVNRPLIFFRAGCSIARRVPPIVVLEAE